MTQTYPRVITVAMLTPADLAAKAVTYSGGAYGDDVDLATATTTVAYSPKNQAEKATFPGAPNSVVPSESITGGQAITSIVDYTLATDITAPRGFIGPRDPYSKTIPAAPTITSLAPNTVAAGSASPLSVVVTGTGFTQWTVLLTGGVQTPYVTYVSPTKLQLLMDPARSTPGVVAVIARDHSVNSAASNFTYT